MIDTVRLSAWILQAMLAWSPIQNHAYAHLETADETAARYEYIADNIARVALEEEPLFAGESGAERSALWITSWIGFESGGFRRDIDNTEATGDGGRSRCLAQIQLRRGETMRSRLDCLHLAWARMRESFQSCPTLPLLERGSVYASGDCSRGRKSSRIHSERALSWWKEHPWPAAATP